LSDANFEKWKSKANDELERINNLKNIYEQTIYYKKTKCIILTKEMLKKSVKYRYKTVQLSEIFFNIYLGTPVDYYPCLTGKGIYSNYTTKSPEIVGRCFRQ